MTEVLFITSPEINFLEDALHEGLDQLLGADQVHCYPYKNYSEFQYNLYPLDHFPPHRDPVDLDVILARREKIAAVIVGSIRKEALNAWRPIQNRFTHCPVALVNGEEGKQIWPDGVWYTHRFWFNLMLGEDTCNLFPLPMCAPSRTMLPVEMDRDLPVSFAARGTHPLRRKVAEILRREGHTVLLDCDIPREQFCGLLNRSLIGVSVRGAEWDTMRYYETPYHGALLLSQRLPIVIPDNFRDGEHAVFFDDLDDMLEKIHSLLADRDRLSRIAAAGCKYAQEKHTAVARARYLLKKLGLNAHKENDPA